MQKIKIYKKNGFYKLKTSQNVHAKIEDIWEYFTEIKNLEKIMPKKYNVKITQGRKGKLYAGKIFNIKMKILPFVYANITSEIKAIEKERLFIDSQVFGPYKMWHHEHLFEEKEDGILMTDIITYAPPMGVLGDIANKLFINKKVNNIFNYRKKIIDQIFNKK